MLIILKGGTSEIVIICKYDLITRVFFEKWVIHVYICISSFLHLFIEFIIIVEWKKV